jgi:CubicO group peptidase (beta-lactamase class C family)
LLKKIKIFLTFFSIIAFITTFCAQQKDKFDFSKIDSLIYDGINKHAFPAAVLLINKDGKIIFNSGYGRLTYNDTSAEVTPKTIFDIASLTKVIAATTAAMICYDRKLFSLDDTVIKYIPSFSVHGKENITIKNLLLHNSGLPAFKRFYLRHSTENEVLNAIYSTELEYKTGSLTVYSDLGMIVLAKVIENVTGKTFDVFCSEEIFSPLNMKSTFFNPPDSLKYKIAPAEFDNYWRNRLVWGEVHDETASLLNGVSGNAGLFSTTADINNLLTSLIFSKKGDKNNIIQKETFQLFTRRQSENSTRALGWDMKSEENSSAGMLFDITSFGHTGFTGTSVWIDPTRNLIVVFLTNRVYPSRENKMLYKLRPLIHDAIIRAVE